MKILVVGKKSAAPRRQLILEELLALSFLPIQNREVDLRTEIVPGDVLATWIVRFEVRRTMK